MRDALDRLASRIRAVIVATAALSLACTALATSSGATASPGTTTLHAVLVTTPRTSIIGQLVSADVHKSTFPSGATFTKAVVTWGDGTKATVLTSLRARAPHRFARAGRFVIKAVVTDSKGRSASASVAEVVTLQHVYWDLFNGQNLSYMLESARLPLAASSADTEISGTPGNKLRCTAGMTTDPKGRLWVLSYPNGCSAPFAAAIEVFTTPVTASSAPVLTFTLPGSGDDDNLTFDRSGHLWVEDTYNKAVYEFAGPFTASRTLVPALTLPTGSATPSGLALDARGDLFVANARSLGSNSIAVYRAPISPSTVPTHLNGLSMPGGLIFDRLGNLYASTNPPKGHGAAIVRYNSNHLGQGARPSIVDAKGLSGTPYESNFAWDGAGNLYVADCGNHASIRVYPLAASPFSARLAPSVQHTNASLSSIGCAWGIAIH